MTYCYIIYAYRDPYELPLACLDTISDCASFIGCTATSIYRLLRGDVSHVDGYSVVRVVL